MRWWLCSLEDVPDMPSEAEGVAVRELNLKSIIRPAQFAHVVLRVSDVAASADWYAKVVGMEAVFQNAFVCFMTFDEEHHRLALIQTPIGERAPKGAVGLDHFAYSFDSLGVLLSTYRRLEAQGIRPVWSINHGPTTSLYYEDLDGNRLEFQVDNFKTESDL